MTDFKFNPDLAKSDSTKPEMPAWAVVGAEVGLISGYRNEQLVISDITKVTRTQVTIEYRDFVFRLDKRGRLSRRADNSWAGDWVLLPSGDINVRRARLIRELKSVAKCIYEHSSSLQSDVLDADRIDSITDLVKAYRQIHSHIKELDNA